MSKEPFGYNENVPEDLRDIFMWLCQDVVSLQQKWDFWLEIFGKQENIDLVSELALASFNIILETLQNDVMMAICRLSDPPKSLGQENLSLATLAESCSAPSGLEKLVTQFKSVCEPVRKRRNKMVSHRDLDTAIKPLEYPLPDISKEQIDTIVKSAVDILNFVVQKYESVEMNFHVASPGDAETLIFWLKAGKAAKSKIRA